MLSKYQLQTLEDHIFSLSKDKILIPILGKKIKYETPLSQLKHLFKFRFTIKKNHSTLKLKQEPFLKPYIKRNTDLQREAEKRR